MSKDTATAVHKWVRRVRTDAEYARDLRLHLLGASIWWDQTLLIWAGYGV